MIKVGVITSVFFPTVGGAEIVIHNLMKQYTKENIDATLYIPQRYYNSLTVEDLPYKIKPFFIPKGIGRLLNFKLLIILYSKLLFKYLERGGKCDVWHAHDASFAGYILAMSGLKNTVLTFHGSDIQIYKEGGYGHRLNHKYEKRLKKDILPNINICTAISRSIRKEIIELKFNKNKIEMIPNGINLDIFSNINKLKNELREEYGFKKDEFIILTSGRNHPKKGYKYIPLIAKFLEESDVAFKWIVVGRKTEEIYEQLVKLKVKSVILRDQIGIKKENPNYIFPDKNLRKIYKMVDCYTFPTLLEGLPLVILEAFASKLPVITTNASGVEDFESCIKIDVDNDLVANMTKSIIKIKEDKYFASQLISDQFDELKSIYTIESVSNQYIEVYKKIVKN
jgi:glycosyltransferase involved in cell wall biosynthesis